MLYPSFIRSFTHINNNNNNNNNNTKQYHITSPDPEGDGLKRALLYALKDAGGLRPEQVDYVNAHGTSTKKNDQFETIAFKHVFGEHATSKKLMISSIKGNSEINKKMMLIIICYCC